MRKDKKGEKRKDIIEKVLVLICDKISEEFHLTGLETYDALGLFVVEGIEFKR